MPYQGKELNVTVGAPTRAVLEDLIGDLKELAWERGLEDFEVLHVGPDPDGGYEATIRAHNLNLRTIGGAIKRAGGWVKGRVGGIRERRREARGREEGEFLEGMRRKAESMGYPLPETYEEAKEFEEFLEEKGEYLEQMRRTRVEEWKSKEREYKRQYKEPSKWERFARGTGRVWKGAKEVAGPRVPIRGWYIPPPHPELYVPGAPSWRPTTEFMPAGEAHRPQLGTLRRVSTPPPTTRIKVPFRDIERLEGLGTAMGRLRRLEEFPAVDQAVYAEIRANTIRVLKEGN